MKGPLRNFFLGLQYFVSLYSFFKPKVTVASRPQMIYGKLSVNHSFTISSSWLSQRTKLCQVKEEDKGASEARVQLSDLTIRLKDGRHF